ncbi:MAG: HD-GYP domain-containing protein [Oscillospiraceae bacterium]
MYSSVLDRTESFIKDITLRGSINKEAATGLVNDLSSSISEENDEVIFHCINEIREADRYLYTHSINVATLNVLMGIWLGLSDEQNKKLVKIGLMHDMGKLRLPQDIINKPGKLSDREFNIVKNHPINSYNMLVEIGEFDKDVLEAVKFHHERENGSGYPNRLQSSQIPLFAKITAISDVYDAMISKRCYKEPVSPFDVLEMLSTNKFSNLDFKLVNKFLEVVPMLLMRKPFVLSDGNIGVVVYIRKDNYRYPVVKVNDRLVVTDEKCRCISVYSPNIG